MSAPTQPTAITTCDEQGVPGVCQANSLRCARCAPPGPFPFAPGAITRHTSRQRQALARWLARAAALMFTAIAIGLVAGLVLGAIAP